MPGQRGRGEGEAQSINCAEEAVFRQQDRAVDDGAPSLLRAVTSPAFGAGRLAIKENRYIFLVFFKLYNQKFIQENTLESTRSVIKHHNGHRSFGVPTLDKRSRGENIADHIELDNYILIGHGEQE